MANNRKLKKVTVREHLQTFWTESTLDGYQL